MKHVSLFTGIGGFEYAAQTVWCDEYNPMLFCEIDKTQRGIHAQQDALPNMDNGTGKVIGIPDRVNKLKGVGKCNLSTFGNGNHAGNKEC